MAPLLKIAAILNFSLLIAAQGTQFITAKCSSDAECASGCCGFNSGKCAGPVIAQERDGGCGFGDAQPNANAAIPFGFTGTPGGKTPPATGAPVPAPAPSTGNNAPAPNTGAGTQFITGPCQSDADCAAGCCGFNTGKCAGPVVAQERDGGCGFGNPQPNANAAIALGFTGQVGGGNAPAANAPVPAPAPAPTGNGNNPNNPNNAPAPNTGNGAGNAAGKQFITGPCQSDADCASGCCGFKSGKCAGAIVAQERDGGCGFGDAQPNDTAAQKLRGQRLGRRGVVYWM